MQEKLTMISIEVGLAVTVGAWMTDLVNALIAHINELVAVALDVSNIL